MPQRLNTMELLYQSLAGSILLDYDTQQLQAFMRHSLGDYLLQIGGPRDFKLAEHSLIKNKVYLSPTRSSVKDEFSIQAGLTELPIIPNSIDLVLMPHMLEFMHDPIHVLEEVKQALAPAGMVVILGFNAYSLWGLQRWRQGRRGFPWHGQFRTLGQVKRWLQQLGFHIVARRTMFFHGPFGKRPQPQRWAMLEALGQTCFPWLGGVYLIIGQKRVMRPDKLPSFEWQSKLRVSSRYAEPTVRTSHRD